MFETYVSTQAEPTKVGFAQHRFFSCFKDAKAFCETYASAVIAVNGELIALWDGSRWAISEEKVEFYVLERDGGYIIVSTTNDPLYGNGSYNLHGGPYPTWDAAAAAVPAAA